MMCRTNKSSTIINGSTGIATKPNANIVKRTKQIFRILKQANPNPTTELIYHSPFELLVAVVLSAQATDVSVNKATKALFRRANTPKAMLALGVEALMDCIKTIGLYKTKANNIIKLSQQLLNKHNAQVPNDFTALVSLAGVGRKTANVVLNTLYARPYIAVDTHVFRVSNRLGIARGATVLLVEKGLDEVIPNEYKANAHHWLILHGRYTCRAIRPDCNNCNIRTYCDYYNNNKI